MLLFIYLFHFIFAIVLQGKQSLTNNVCLPFLSEPFLKFAAVKLLLCSVLRFIVVGRRSVLATIPSLSTQRSENVLK